MTPPFRRLLPRLLLAFALAFCGLLLAPTPTAHATEPGNNYPSSWRYAAQDSVVDSWGYYNRECTSWAAWALHNRNKFEMPRAIGNAHNWGYWAAGHGYAVNTTPAVGALAWWPSGKLDNGYNHATYGHVAWVSAVSGSKVTIQEYNHAVRGGYDTRTIVRGSTQQVQFIHFKDLSLVKTASPYVSGAAKVGSRLTAHRGTWKSGSGAWPSATVTYKYQWYVNGVRISGANSSTYTPTPAMVGKRISFNVAAYASGYRSSWAGSNQTAPVAKALMTNTVLPTISGTAQVDDVLRVTTGSWSPTPTSYAYHWYADGVPISGATGPTYTPRPADVGRRLLVSVRAIRDGYYIAETARTEPTAAVRRIGTVARLRIAKVPTPRRRGKAVVRIVSATGAVVHGTGKIVIKRRGAAKRITFRIVDGRAVVRLPRLRRGTWQVRAKYVGTGRFAPDRSTRVKIRVRR